MTEVLDWPRPRGHAAAEEKLGGRFGVDHSFKAKAVKGHRFVNSGAYFRQRRPPYFLMAATAFFAASSRFSADVMGRPLSDRILLAS